ncbi:ABC transporter ATP-binding protein/permease [Natronococcus wangiae]|uniref:ABC transporter ATP-binding protein/permease n=1 Tax=Natronococcus wangiae TaxID=3068275 RepID=UPI00273E9F45|nr:ATP-binding cassette domain-containing protein [Natronococcus sp. AD5]
MSDDRNGVLGRLLASAPAAGGRREWFAVVGGIGVLVFVAVGALGPALAPYPADEMVGPPFAEPGEDHLLGTDDVGHDILSLLLVGARVSMLVGIVAGTVAILVGTAVGVTAGLLGGRTDRSVMRFVDIVLTIPFLPLIIVVAAVLGPGLWTTIGVLSAVMWARPARELRSEVLSIRNREYIEASRSMGASAFHVATRYVVPAVSLIVVAQYARAVSMAILLEAALSFLGLGDPTAPSWGTILFYAQQRSAFLTEAWKWWVIPPGLAITCSVLSFIFVTLGVERRTGARRRSVGTTVPGADIDVVRTGRDEPRSSGDEGGATTDGGSRLDSAPVLEVADLTVEYDTGPDAAVDDVDLDLRAGERLGIVGESGSGKSSVALALLDLLRPPARVTDGRVTLYADRDRAESVDLADVRGDAISFVPQEAMNALDPRLTLEEQLVEAVRVHRPVERDRAAEIARDTLESVGLPPESYDRHPHELSGGMCQRGVIAMALVNDPAVLVVDEPTTGLDVVTTVRVLELLEGLQAKRDFSLVVISHDLAAVTRLADRIAVMRDGTVVEVGATDRLRTAPAHPYTEALLDARTTMPSLDQATDGRPPADQTDPHLVYEDITKSFGDERVLDGADLRVDRGRSVALLGESGAGKTTLGKMALGLLTPDSGVVRIDGEPVGQWSSLDPKRRGREDHYLFQDPYSSLAPNRTVERIVREPLDIHEVGAESARTERVRAALADVGLEPAAAYARRYSSELSGGERQRVALARALVLEPSLLVADEPTSMLDAPLQEELLELLYELVAERGITLLHITHDVAQASTFADEIAVLHDGRIVEQASVASILREPDREQTGRLVDAAEKLSTTESAGDHQPAGDGKTDG